MSIFTILMLAALGAAVVACRDGLSVWLLVAFSAPFFALPGMSDALYLPVERNAPFLGGALAFLMGCVILWRSQEPWHLVLSMLLACMMLWNAGRILGMSGAGSHAIGLEVIFYAGMVAGILSRWGDFGSFLPDPGAVRGALSVWRSGV